MPVALESFIGEPHVGNARGIAVNATHIFWANSTLDEHSTIARAKLDGTSVVDDFIILHGGGVEFDPPTCLVLDDTYLYWGNLNDHEIVRAKLDGTGAANFITVASTVSAIALSATHIYWYDSFFQRIGRARLDGSEVMPVLINAPGHSVAMTVGGPYLFWASSLLGGLWRAKLDGSEAKEIISASDFSDTALGGMTTHDKHLYFSSPFGVQRVTFDGTEAQLEYTRAALGLSFGVEGRLYGAAIGESEGHILRSAIKPSPVPSAIGKIGAGASTVGVVRPDPHYAQRG